MRAFLIFFALFHSLHFEIRRWKVNCSRTCVCTCVSGYQRLLLVWKTDTSSQFQTLKHNIVQLVHLVASSHTWLIPDTAHTKQSVLYSHLLSNSPKFGYSIPRADILLRVHMAVVLDHHSPGDWADELKTPLAKEDGNFFLSRWAPHIIRDSVFLYPPVQLTLIRRMNRKFMTANFFPVFPLQEDSYPILIMKVHKTAKLIS